MDRGSQLDEEDEEEAGEAEGRRSGRQERKAADIKSNNPHLAGGEEIKKKSKRPQKKDRARSKNPTRTYQLMDFV